MTLNVQKPDFMDVVYDNIYSVIKPDLSLIYLVEEGRLRLQGDPLRGAAIKPEVKQYHDTGYQWTQDRRGCHPENHNELERKLEERTFELAKANQQLKDKADNLKEANIALNVLLKKRENDKKELE